MKSFSNFSKCLYRRCTGLAASLALDKNKKWVCVSARVYMCVMCVHNKYRTYGTRDVGACTSRTTSPETVIDVTILAFDPANGRHSDDLKQQSDA